MPVPCCRAAISSWITNPMKQLDFSLLSNGKGVDSKGDPILCANIEESLDALGKLSSWSEVHAMCKAHRPQPLSPARFKEVLAGKKFRSRPHEDEDLVNKRIPGNIKEIAIARSYGDLRENFEYKAAKQMQAVLNRRKMELEKDLDNAQGSDLTGADTSAVNIGTVVKLRHESATEQYTILGAWDSDPDKRIVSYMSEIGQALIGQEVGDTVEFRDLESEEERTYEIAEITAWK